MQSVTFQMKVMTRAGQGSVAEKEVTSSMLLTSAIDTPLKLLWLLGLLLQHCDFCILTLSLVKIKVCETMDLISISITFRIFPHGVEQHAPNHMEAVLAARTINTGKY